MICRRRPGRITCVAYAEPGPHGSRIDFPHWRRGSRQRLLLERFERGTSCDPRANQGGTHVPEISHRCGLCAFRRVGVRARRDQVCAGATARPEGPWPLGKRAGSPEEHQCGTGPLGKRAGPEDAQAEYRTWLRKRWHAQVTRLPSRLRGRVRSAPRSRFVCRGEEKPRRPGASCLGSRRRAASGSKL